MKGKAKKGIFKKIAKVFSISLIVVILALSVSFFSIYFSAKLDKNIAYGNTEIKVFDNVDEEIQSPSSINVYVKYDEISPHIINAFVALEDKRFFKHNGIDYIRVGGALVNNLKAGYIKEGGSTITQQLAKNTQLSNKKTLQRKIKEAKLAKDIESEFSKEEILEIYLNAIYFGNSIYGINQACMRFFNKKPIEISLFEAAILAGVVKNPGKNSPLRHPENADKRKNLVLRLMKEQGYIDAFQYENNIEKTFTKPERDNSELNLPYYNAVIAEAATKLSISEKAIIESGLNIYTYYDKHKQNLVHKAFQSGEYAIENADYSALMLDNESGGASAYFATHSNNIYDLRRQPGSAIKPILVYAPALQIKHITPATIFNDEKISFGNYEPSNYQNSYLGITTVRNCVAHSSNIAAVKLLEEIGIGYAKGVASNMGLQFQSDDEYLPLALGGMTNGVTSVELAESYMCLANGGTHKSASFIKKITDKDGRIIYENRQLPERVLSEETAYLMTDMLMDAAEYGTAKKLSSINYQIAAKTGTVGGADGRNTDAWNVSYSKDNTMCVWYGNLSGSTENNISLTGGSYPTMLCKYVLINLSPAENFYIPENIVEIKIDTLATSEFKTIMLATDNTPAQYQKYEVFDAMNVPTEYSPLYELPKTNMSLQSSSVGAEIGFDALPYFEYKVLRKNLTTGEIEYIFSANEQNGRISLIDECADQGIFSYSLEVVGKYGNLGVAEEKLLLLGP